MTKAPRLPRNHYYPKHLSVSENVGALIGIAIVIGVLFLQWLNHQP